MEKGAKFQHYKGGIYTFHGMGLHSETQEVMVAYSGENNSLWFRPASIFFGMVEKAGRSFPRFRLMTSSEKNTECRKVEVFFNGEWIEIPFTALQPHDVFRLDEEGCYIATTIPYLYDGFWKIRYVQLFKFDDGHCHWIVAKSQREAEEYYVHDYGGEKEYTVKLLSAKELTENVSSQEGQYNSWLKIALESNIVPNCIGDDSGYGDPL